MLGRKRSGGLEHPDSLPHHSPLLQIPPTKFVEEKRGGTCPLPSVPEAPPDGERERARIWPHVPRDLPPSSLHSHPEYASFLPFPPYSSHRPSPLLIHQHWQTLQFHQSGHWTISDCDDVLTALAGTVTFRRHCWGVTLFGHPCWQNRNSGRIGLLISLESQLLLA